MKQAYFKYRELYQSGPNGTKEVNPFTRSIFEKAEIYYAAPITLNDPFDCNQRIHTNGSTDEQWQRHADELIALEPQAREVLERFKANQLWKANKELADSIGLKQHQEHLEKSSVFCLSKKNNSTTMFTYYAGNHTGIAIEFRFCDVEVPCGIPCGNLSNPNFLYQRKIIFRDVVYDDAPELNFHKLRNTPQLLINTLFTKSSAWSHEKEFRIFRRKVPASVVVFEKKLLTRVIFGYRTTEADVALVKGWLAGWPSGVILSKAEMVPGKSDFLIRDFDAV